MELKLNNKLSPRALEDFELVKDAIEGDQRAFTNLMDRYRHSIFHAMYRMVNNTEDAHDLTMEAFGKAFNKLDSYAPNFAFSTWLFKIAVNNCIDHIRKKRINLLSIDDPIEADSDHSFSGTINSNSQTPEEGFIRTQRIEMMRRVLQKLSIKYRLMIELRYFEELSYEEIAQELDIPLGTVKAQLFRAKEILFALLQQPGAQAYFDTRLRKAS